MDKRLRSKLELFEWVAMNEKQLKECFLFETEIIDAINEGNDDLTLHAYCDFCHQEVDLRLENTNALMGNIYLHENLFCPVCGTSSKNRQMYHELCKCANSNEDVYLYEQITPMYCAVKKNFPNVVGSEYLCTDMDQYKSGEIVNGILHEDATELSFQDESFDAILSSHVFEHVFGIEKALKEAWRVLKKDGKLLISLPFVYIADKTVVRAKLQGGKVVHLQKPVYHGNPLSSDGSLAVYDYGWDFLDKIRAAGFSDVYLEPYFDSEHGIMGIDYYNRIFCPQFVIIAEKN